MCKYDILGKNLFSFSFAYIKSLMQSRTFIIAFTTSGSIDK